MKIQQKRIYDAISDDDGKRILFDRLWPRGIKKEDAKIDMWPKVLTPSNELRKWYHESPEQRWDEFQQRYRIELEEQAFALQELREYIANEESVTLLTASKNEEYNHLTVLKKILETKK